MCVCVMRSEKHIEQNVKSLHHILSIQHFNVNSTSPMSNWPHICATPAQPLQRVLKESAKDETKKQGLAKEKLQKLKANGRY